MGNRFEHFVVGANCHFKYAQGAPSVEGTEFHSYNEMVLFLEGESRLISANIQLPLKHGSIVIIPREQFHQFVVTAPENYVRCILGFESTDELAPIIGEVMNEVAVISHPPAELRYVFDSLMRMATSPISNEEQTLFLKSHVSLAILELKLFSGEPINRHMLLSPLTEQALSYIDEHYSQPISVATIAKALNTSPSSLSHKFKADLSISVYRYLSEKRLSAARQLVSQGESLTRAAFLCGFREYSAFFRLYKKHYRSKPSDSVPEKETL